MVSLLKVTGRPELTPCQTISPLCWLPLRKPCAQARRETTEKWQFPRHGPKEKSVCGVLTAPKKAMLVPKLTAVGTMLNFPAW